MNKTKLLFGAVIFSLAGFIMAKANTRFAAAKAYVKCGVTGMCLSVDNATAAAGVRWTTVGAVQARITTSAGGSMLVYANSTCTTAAYFIGC